MKTVFPKIDTSSLLAERAMLATLSISQWRPRKKDKATTGEILVQKHAQDGAGLFIKQLMPKGAMKEIHAVESEARQEHNKLTLPWKDEGQRILAARKFMDYQKVFQKLRERFETAVSDFIGSYPGYVREAPNRMKDLWMASDFPAVSDVRRAFAFRMNFLPVPTAADFRVDLPQGQLDVLQESVKEQTEELMKEMQRDLWRRLGEPLQHLVERLREPDARLHDTVVGNLVEVLDLIPDLVIQEDPVLNKFMAEVRQQVAGVSMEDLRNDNKVRQQTMSAADALVHRMMPFMPKD